MTPISCNIENDFNFARSSNVIMNLLMSLVIPCNSREIYIFIDQKGLYEVLNFRST